MTGINHTTSYAQSHPVRTGVFAVLSIVAAGALAAVVLGFNSPANSYAQTIFVTAPAYVPPTPLPPTPVMLPMPPAPIPVAPSNPTNTTNTSNSNTDSSNQDIVVNGHADDSGGEPIVVTGTLDVPIYTSPCCTTTTDNSTPATSNTDITVTGTIDTPVYTSPCCTTDIPVTPPPPVPTPIIPTTFIPPPPPPGSTSGCIYLTASVTNIHSGDPVTIAWKTNNVSSITITNLGTFTGAEAASGSRVVNPVVDTSYVGSVPGDENNPNCAKVVHIVPPTTDSHSCVFLTASATDIQAGDAVTITWKTQNVSSVTITNLGTFTGAEALSGSRVVTPSVDTTYAASVEGDQNNPNCAKTVHIIPKVEVHSCVFLTASASEIHAGDPVTISWKTENAPSVTITNVGTFTGAEAASGSRVVNPTVNTTYAASVAGDENNPNCAKTVTITTTNSSHSCVFLTASATSVSPGSTVTLSWKTSNASSITIDNGVGSVTPVSEGTTTVVVNSNITYHASVPGDENNSNCTVAITTTTGGGGGGGGGGGHSSKPDVYFTSSSREAPPLGSVYLSQIPYTGLDLGTFGTILYWTMLVGWSLALAYLILFGGFPLLRRKLAAFGSSVSDAVNAQPNAHAMPITHVAAPAPVVNHAVQESAAPAMPHVAPRTAPSPRMEMSGEGFKRFASAETLTIDDIVKGLSRESDTHASPEAPVTHREITADEAYIVESPAPVAREAAAPAPRAENKAEAAAVHPDVVAFIGAILEGERDVVFTTIRRLNQAGHDAEEFMAHAICALDDAYRARIDGTPVHEDVQRATAHCATPFLERLVTSLTTAVDGSYSMGTTGIKLALTRALSVAQG